jgi:hypothetical protein
MQSPPKRIPATTNQERGWRIQGWAAGVVRWDMGYGRGGKFMIQSDWNLSELSGGPALGVVAETGHFAFAQDHTPKTGRAPGHDPRPAIDSATDRRYAQMRSMASDLWHVKTWKLPF